MKNLTELSRQKKSLLCVGLDSDLRRIPAFLHSYDDPIYEFNKRIIEATAEFAIAYKPNLAFYEALGPKGWETLRKTLEVMPRDVFTIADAKRGDIGNTSRMYAEAFFETFGFDSVTVAPYMGRDSVTPFLEFPGKTVFLLALTSNEGAADFQWTGTEGQPLYQTVVEKSQAWAKEYPGELGYVVGATRPQYLAEIRAMAPENWFLVPGVGAQGGSLEEVMAHGRNPQGGLLINASRSIIYASDGEDFADKAREEARGFCW
ncbi:MAG: orotidine-5'-phosphate decarboxylase [Bacteroidia bacterium]|nr:orotidine-5'-phosphate decarboxylase [Bacteroidia bacterium]